IAVDDTFARSISVSHFPAKPAPAMISESAKSNAGSAAAATTRKRNFFKHNGFMEHLRGMESAQGRAFFVRIGRTKDLHARPVPSLSRDDTGSSRRTASRWPDRAVAVRGERRAGLGQKELVAGGDL